MKDNFKVFATEDNITVVWQLSIIERGTVDAFHAGEGIWWITRALVQPTKCRNQGVGSVMLRMLINKIAGFHGKKIFVTPGGYEGEKNKQFNFYEKNGFIIPSVDEIECPNKARVYYMSFS